ncbi:FecR family protein [Chitinophaga defluvii]|uniref:FecR family protein n=1 Tax=Chitinophaga defluvii TaxID=3163343 RepID=A0ABV2TCL7_9BACT
MEQQTRLQYLLEQLVAHTATDEELAELADLAGKDNTDHAIAAIEQLLQQDPAAYPEPYDREKWMTVANNILAADKMETVRKPVERKIPVLRRYRWVAAAAILGVIALGSYLWWQQRPVINVVVVPAQDVLPGGSKAMLTLGDGSTVALDSAGNQVIHQGSTAIYQRHGQLQYETGNGAGAVSLNMLTTPRGGQYQLRLPDGSTVWLNAASTLKYPTAFSDTGRLVELTGEAYFEIRPLSNALAAGGNKKVPFRVKVNNMTVEVLGTAFNVQAYPDESKVTTTLINGKVKLNSNSETLMLQPGQQAQLEEGGRLNLLADADIEQAVAWKNGYFRFVKTDIQSIMQQLSRWYDVEVRYEKGLKPYSFGAIISRNNNISQVLNMLEATGEVHFKVEGRQVLVMP